MQRMRRELQQQMERETALRNDVAALQQQLSDANQGLRAAARLSDQLEAGQQTIAVLRDEGEWGNISVNIISVIIHIHIISMIRMGALGVLTMTNPANTYIRNSYVRVSKPRTHLASLESCKLPTSKYPIYQ